MTAAVRIEFTVEPFVDGRPGAHVVAAWEAVSHVGYTLENGPFSASVDVPAADAGRVIQGIVDAAYGAGATRVSLTAEAIDG